MDKPSAGMSWTQECLRSAEEPGGIILPIPLIGHQALNMLCVHVSVNGC